MVLTQVLNKSFVDTKKITNIILTSLIVIGALFVPTFLAKLVPLGKYQQLIIGTVVNTSLVLTAIYMKGTFKTLAIATLPSISTILSGVLFSNMTVYTKYMIPAIWLGNLTFIFIYKFLFIYKKTNYILSAVPAIILKVSIIYLGFVLMSSSVNIPDMAKQTLNTSMGLTQLITATCGSTLGFLISGFYKVSNK